METLYQILGLIGGGLIAFLIYKTIKNQPDMFSKANLSKSFSTLGLLGLGLIAFVAVLVLLLRAA